eukprot:366281-Chlamydomonas_euryale.AAC.10
MLGRASFAGTKASRPRAHLRLAEPLRGCTTAPRQGKVWGASPTSPIRSSWFASPAASRCAERRLSREFCDLLTKVLLYPPRQKLWTA